MNGAGRVLRHPNMGMADAFNDNGLLPRSIDIAPWFTDEFNSSTSGR